ncbi:MAG: hypothetical protein ACK5VI_07770 [Opitutia bacterium]
MRIAALATALLVAASLAAEDAPARKARPTERPAPAEGESSRPRSRENAERPPFRGEMAERLGRLKEAGVTPEEMSKLRSALEAARADEAVKVARAEAEKAREAMREALQAFAKSKGVAQPEAPREGERRERPSPERMAEMRKAMEGARNDPAVKAAFEASRAAGAKLREAVSAAVIKADASLAATLEKMGELRNEFLGDRPREGSPRGPRPEGDAPRGPRPEGAKPKGPRPDGFEAVPAKSEGA